MRRPDFQSYASSLTRDALNKTIKDTCFVAFILHHEKLEYGAPKVIFSPSREKSPSKFSCVHQAGLRAISTPQTLTTERIFDSKLVN